MGHAIILSASSGGGGRAGTRRRRYQRADRRTGFVLANSTRNAHSCSMKMTEDIRKCATEVGIPGSFAQASQARRSLPKGG